MAFHSDQHKARARSEAEKIGVIVENRWFCNSCLDRVFVRTDQGYALCVLCNSGVSGYYEQVVEQHAWDNRKSTYTFKDAEKDSKEVTTDTGKARLNYYEEFSFILWKMTESLVKCGAPAETMDEVFKMWIMYLKKMEAAFCTPKTEEIPESRPTSCEPSDNEAGNETTFVDDEENDKENPLDMSALYGRVKTPTKKREYKSRKVDLLATPNEFLTPRQIKRKKNLNLLGGIAFMKHAEATESGHNISESPINNSSSELKMEFSRFSTLKKIIPEVNEIEPCRKIRKKSPKYMTLQKLVSFLHGQMIRSSVPIYDSDLIRWIREGHIPLIGAHLLLPDDKRKALINHDSQVVGGLSSHHKLKGINLKYLRSSTYKLMHFLGFDVLPRPPACVVARKILEDLQLPDDLIDTVYWLDWLISQDNCHWQEKKFSDSMFSSTTYAGALILIALKWLIGLDGTTELENSKLAERVNCVLELEPSSSYSQGAPAFSFTRPEIKTLFVWNDWVQFARYRRSALESNHVPTAIRRGKTDRLDPELMSHFVRNEGKLHSCHVDPKKEKLQLIQQLEEIKLQDEPQRPVPIFRPSLLGIHGLAEQLLEHDPVQFALLKQRFPASTLGFVLEPKVLSKALKDAKRPHSLKVHPGPAFSHLGLRMPILARNFKPSKLKDPFVLNAFKTIELPLLPTADNDNQLILYQPFHNCWSLYCHVNDSTYSPPEEEWKQWSKQLPPSFVFLLDLIAESIEDEPSDIYVKMCFLEMAVVRHAKGQHTITPPKVLVQQIETSMKAVL